MNGPSPIEWTDATWNPIGGCSIHSAACGPCYAQQLAGTRLRSHPLYAGTTTSVKGKPVFNGHLTALSFDHPTWTWPLRWRGAKAPTLGPGRPSLIFVGDMSDLFHEQRPLGYAMRIWMTAYRVEGRHILQLLTKRPEVMLDFVRRWQDVEPEDGDVIMANGPLDVRAAHSSGRAGLFAAYLDTMGTPPAGAAFPLYDWMEGPRWWPNRPENVWLGFSAERQAEFDARWPAMHALAALGFTVFLSYEPAMGPLRLPDDFLALGRRAQVIAGGMSGRDAEPAHPDWFRALRDQCAPAGLPFFFKQWGEWGRNGSVDTYSHGPDGRQRRYPNAEGIAWLPDGRIALRDFPVLEHAARIKAGIARDTRAIDVDETALNDFYASCEAGPVLPLEWMYHVGKKAAGRLLDGIQHDGLPALAAGERVDL